MANHLQFETSPYLRQHAQNPVDWYPWGGEALDLAKQLDKPILLSIGYSACHWCHVMAHESFEDPEVAALMNQHFINIKVDREERPDLDQIYQTAHAMLTGHGGGWPLTLFLTPDQLPFFAGTYFPKTAHYNLPGFMELLPRIAGIYHEKPGEIQQQSASLLEALTRQLPSPVTHKPELSAAPLEAALSQFAAAFDTVHGGIGGAPKFPHPAELDFCLHRYSADDSQVAREIVNLTLTEMSMGGIFDQLGGGFYRYSVDDNWTIPHFEKMLYDNGPLLGLYSDAWAAFGDPAYKETAEETAEWVMREMQSADGGYFSSLNADSEHEEGKFYVWTPDEIGALLNTEEYAVVAPYFGLDGAPNFEGRHWHLRVTKPLTDISRNLHLPAEECKKHLASARAKLLSARMGRTRPGRDEKILVSWNGLMIKGMARASRIFERSDLLRSAQRATDFIRSSMWKDGRLAATCKDGKAHLNAYLDDYAFLLDSLLELLQAEFRQHDLDFARELAQVLLDQFEDKESGGFYFTSHDHEKLIHRMKPGPDNATPSENGIAAFALQRLGHVLGDVSLLEASARTIRLFYPALLRQPSTFSSLLLALEEKLNPPRIIVLRGEREEIAAWHQKLARYYRPDTLVLAIPNDTPDLPSALDKPHTAHASAWVCRGVNCLPPIGNLEALLPEVVSRTNRRSP